MTDFQATYGKVSNLRLFAVTIFLTFTSATTYPSPELPSLGDASSKIISPELEKRLGREFLKQIHASMKTTDDPLLKYYSETQIKRLVQYSDFRDEILDIVVVDSPSLNAFAAPGGVVGVNLGLFLQADDVHEFLSLIHI